MQRMEGLPYKMISSSLVGPVGKDYRQSKARDHRKLAIIDLVAKNIRDYPSLEVCMYILHNLLAVMS